MDVHTTADSTQPSLSDILEMRTSNSRLLRTKFDPMTVALARPIRRSATGSQTLHGYQ